MRGVWSVCLALLVGGGAAAQPARVNVEELGRLPAFSHATVAGDLIFVSGTLGTKPGTLDLVDGGAGPQTTQTMKNIERILRETGASLRDVAKCTVFLLNMDDYEAMNAAYIPFFDGSPPARATLGAAALALGAAVEIECIAQRPSARGTGGASVDYRSGTVSSWGENIYYEEAGSGETVVLTHGFGGNHAIWYQQVPVFAERYRVVTWDQRGFGRSSNMQDAPGPQTAARDLETLLDHLGVERAHVVGQSMGGWAALGFAVAHPERVRSLVLADTIGGIYTEAIERHFDAYLERAALTGRPDVQPIAAHPALGADLGARAPERAFLYQKIGGLGGAPPPSIPGQLRGTAWPASKLAALRVPTLFVVGSDDPIFPPDLVREAAARLPQSGVVEIARTGHSPYFERPDAWNEAVLAFLDGHRD